MESAGELSTGPSEITTGYDAEYVKGVGRTIAQLLDSTREEFHQECPFAAATVRINRAKGNHRT